MALIAHPRQRSSSELRSFRGPTFLGPSRATSRLDAILDEFSELWQRGRQPRAEDFLDRIEGADPEDLVELIYHEFCLAEASGGTPDPADYVRRFPAHATRLGRLLGLHEAIDPGRLRVWAEPDDLPRAGDAIGPFRLVRELGHGGFARVFLAVQTDLSNRPVVLKVSTRPSGEPHLLARVQHPHIVQVMRHAEADTGALQLICMPFLGGATLAEALSSAWSRSRRPRSGRTLLDGLDRVAAPEIPPAGAVGPTRDLIGRLSYPQAIAWLVARLAVALDHAQLARGHPRRSQALERAAGCRRPADVAGLQPRRGLAGRHRVPRRRWHACLHGPRATPRPGQPRRFPTALAPRSPSR